MADTRWAVEIKASAERFVEKLGKGNRKTAVKITAEMVSLGRDPFPFGFKKLAGSTNEYRIRVGDYRILYTVDAAKRVVLIHDVERRDKAY